MSQRSEQELVRFAKLEKLREFGYPYPNDVKVDISAADMAKVAPLPPEESKRYVLAGRIVQQRLMGKAAFVHILDSSGRIQLYIKQDVLGAEAYDRFKELDLGDIVEAKGYAFVTKTGEQSVYVESLRLLAKSLIPPPEKWHGLTDVETRFRQRYVDLFSNPSVRDVFVTRAAIIRKIRAFLDARGFLEVETPVLHHIAGGATARPFATHHNSLGADMFLRIALELPLKKLVVGGLERVYEIGRVFRNEGLSKKHNPEFSMLEFYQAYATFEDLIVLTEEMLSELVIEVCGSSTITYGEQQINFARPWRRVSMLESIHEIGGVDTSLDLNDLNTLLKIAEQHKVKLTDKADWGRTLADIWGDLVEPKIVDPTFITHHPFSTSPLARQNLADPRVTDRFELIIAGMEAANAFSELNDPIDQRARFEAQAQRKAAGDHEEPDVEQDFLTALEYGLPPTAGEGIGIDRLVMILTNSPSIREVLLFPQLKPEVTQASSSEAANQANQQEAK